MFTSGLNIFSLPQKPRWPRRKTIVGEELPLQIPQHVWGQESWQQRSAEKGSKGQEEGVGIAK